MLIWLVFLNILKQFYKHCTIQIIHDFHIVLESEKGKRAIKYKGSKLSTVRDTLERIPSELLSKRRSKLLEVDNNSLLMVTINFSLSNESVARVLIARFRAGYCTTLDYPDLTGYLPDPENLSRFFPVTNSALTLLVGRVIWTIKTRPRYDL